MIKCDFCICSKPNWRRQMVCGYRPFDYVGFKNDYCKEAIEKMEKAIKEHKDEYRR